MYLQKLVQALSDNEQIAAARTSYAYWYLESGGGGGGGGQRQQSLQNDHACSNTSIDNDDNNNNDSTRKYDVSSNRRVKMAMREARRHLRAEKYDFDAALHRLQETCKYRMVSLEIGVCTYVCVCVCVCVCVSSIILNFLKSSCRSIFFLINFIRNIMLI